ncbi:hypothetical protein DL95DRAFT_472003 [Leptodontidium sp. 2 PMI_412]|nr:hypothetical protein DL95DRAFT_472003 [Leptodontidium sp. 2 PMI_412]
MKGSSTFCKLLVAGTIGDFLGANLTALAFVQAPKALPISCGTEEYFSVTAFNLIDSAGKATFIRYHIVLDTEEVQKEDPDYLSKEPEKHLGEGSIGFKILAQVPRVIWLMMQLLTLLRTVPLSL